MLETIIALSLIVVLLLGAVAWLARRVVIERSRVRWCHQLLVYHREQLAECLEQAAQVPHRLAIYMDALPGKAEEGGA